MADPTEPKRAKRAKLTHELENSRRLIVVLEMACLETVKLGKDSNYQLLNCDDHATLLKKHKRDPAEMRPDITHQCMLALFDSPLNKAGLLQVYVHTQKNVLIEVSPHTRIPRTYKRFAGLMVQLLHKYTIRATNGPDQLLKVIKNPITDHLPSGCRKIGLEVDGDLVRLQDYLKTLPDNEPIVFAIGAMAKGNIKCDYVEDTVSLSQYPLSGAAACSRLVENFCMRWKVL